MARDNILSVSMCYNFLAAGRGFLTIVPLGGKVVHIVEVNLVERDLQFPYAGVGMVVAQPFVEFTDHEPFTCSPASKQRQLDTVTATLNVSRAASHGAEKTHFTIFPECSIPGPEGIALIDNALASADWPNGTVVIGGVDGLTREQFSTLGQAHGTHLDTENNGLDRIQAHEWVNCCITWIKFPNGVVERWIQPKIAPAWVERNVQYQSMFQGRSVFVFKGMFDNNISPYHFCSLLCFDWVADVDGQRVWKWVVTGLGQRALAAQAETSLSWVFVVQSNPQPSHASFLGQIEAFFDQTIQPNVHRDRACLVMVNTAGNINPGRITHYGATAVLHSGSAQFTRPECSPTYSNGGPKRRSSGQLGQLRDALFREGGACVHSFFQTNPASLVPGAAGKMHAILRPFVYPLGEQQDRRTPSAIVPACIKWINDDLDDGTKCLAVRFPHAVLTPQATAGHSLTVEALRSIEPYSTEKAVRLACPSAGKTADDWDISESRALEHVVQTLTIFDIAKILGSIQGEPSHATVTSGEKKLDVVAIRADSHEKCVDHLKNNAPTSRHPLVLVSRDEENTDWSKSFQSFLNTPSENMDEVNITDPIGNVRHVGYRTLQDAFRNAATEAELTGAINAILTA
ncbi:hypothetical protein [Dyella sp.]|uniref:hypothetical protein n=1 Tax=Dyella sp. TaxID=1869338 RepID=UPI002B48EACC|nr:hypothetical protein [Dyella sp.]HKT29426.1 hypothetical protein [Dyella sp.]